MIYISEGNIFLNFRENFVHLLQMHSNREILFSKITSRRADRSIASNINVINLLKPTVYLMHQQFNIQQLYAVPTLYLCVLYLSENKQRLVPLTP
jgi:hypothetical protein